MLRGREFEDSFNSLACEVINICMVKVPFCVDLAEKLHYLLNPKHLLSTFLPISRPIQEANKFLGLMLNQLNELVIYHLVFQVCHGPPILTSYSRYDMRTS